MLANMNCYISKNYGFQSKTLPNFLKQSHKTIFVFDEKINSLLDRFFANAK